jgi:hypothetical protein
LNFSFVRCPLPGVVILKRCELQGIADCLSLQIGFRRGVLLRSDPLEWLDITTLLRENSPVSKLKKKVQQIRVGWLSRDEAFKLSRPSAPRLNDLFIKVNRLH